MAYRVENAFAQREVKLLLDVAGQLIGTDGTAKIELEAVARAKYFQFLFKAPFEGTSLQIFGTLILSQQVTDFGNGFVDVVFDILQLDFDSLAIIQKLLSAGFGAHLHGREGLQDAIVKLPGDS
jgi:hypothetical protein